MRRELRQTELDSKAEILFQTAQNRMTQLLAAGMEEKYKSGGDVKRFTYIPLDAEEDKYDETDVGRLPLWYVTDAEKDNASAAAYYILPREQTDAELREGAGRAYRARRAALPQPARENGEGRLLWRRRGGGQ